ncbi:hypothetical protein LCGC14_2803910 [marine sediment metagenome]|uniref:Uncharacterized protein n=1 Tax=marine sediment metagenome TaxID=412755 RepID=A0A0F9BDA7_9ZZZZ
MKKYLKIVGLILLVILLSWMACPSHGQCIDGNVRYHKSLTMMVGDHQSESLKLTDL